MKQQPQNGRRVPVFLISACLLPTAFGLYRLGQIVAGRNFSLAFTPDAVDQLPLFIHVIGALGFLLLGALQILPGWRHRRPRWHKKIGRWAAPLGVIGALAGVWLTLAHPDINGDLLFWGRLAAGLFWIAAITLALRAITRRDFKTHGAWMIRAYAIALPAGTLAFIMLPLVLVIGEDGHEYLFEVIQVLAWPAHLAIAEWIIRRRAARSTSPGRTLFLTHQRGV
jgi:hypothetical protein